MILGRGMARTDEAIITEFLQFLEETDSLRHPKLIKRVKEAPLVMRRRIGKPILEWSAEDILALYAGREKATWYVYNDFLTYLLFRGYHRASMFLVEHMHGKLCQYWAPILRPYREKIEHTCQHLGYRQVGTGTILTLLLWLLCWVGKPLEELTRPDFERFRDAYQQWYRETKRYDGHPNARVSRLERYLIEWKVIPPAPTILRAEEYLASIRHPVFRTACLTYLNWSSVKHRHSTAMATRRALVLFFSWLEEQYPTCDRLDQVSRAMALAYAQFLKRLQEEGQYSQVYWQALYRSMRLFFAFAIEEHVDTAPLQNPFSAKDLPRKPEMLPRYFSDQEVRAIVHYAEQQASLLERTILITLLHTGIRAAELARLKASDLVQVAGKWKLHIHEGKGLKDRVIPLTDVCVRALHEWQEQGWEKRNGHLFTHHGQPWRGPGQVRVVTRQVEQKLGLHGITPHRFRHTFAVALLNYGIRESALQKLMGHATLNMTLEYARILDRSVEHAFSQAVEEMQEGPQSWVPNFFVQEDYTLFAEGDTVSWIQLPVGFCRRNPKLHCESDVKCFLCDRFCATAKDLPRLQQMYERFTKLGLGLKAEVVAAQIQQLQALPQNGAPVVIPMNAISVAPKRMGKH
jgi:integrase/recombinase XerC